jgi:hypothetical protein
MQLYDWSNIVVDGGITLRMHENDDTGAE